MSSPKDEGRRPPKPLLDQRTRENLFLVLLWYGPMLPLREPWSESGVLRGMRHYLRWRLLCIVVASVRPSFAIRVPLSKRMMRCSGGSSIAGGGGRNKKRGRRGCCKANGWTRGETRRKEAVKRLSATHTHETPDASLQPPKREKESLWVASSMRHDTPRLASSSSSGMGSRELSCPAPVSKEKACKPGGGMMAAATEVEVPLGKRPLISPFSALLRDILSFFWWPGESSFFPPSFAPFFPACKRLSTPQHPDTQQ